MTADIAIKELAERYSLTEGKTEHYYRLHSTWCVTKKGAERIRVAEGITMSKPERVWSPDGSVVEYLAEFKDKNGNSIWTNGSCRTDGTKNTPAKTHSCEMALKRLKTRGVLELVAAGEMIYGKDEMTDEYIKHGNAANEMDYNGTAPPQTTAQPVSQAVPQAPPSTQHVTVQELEAQFNAANAGPDTTVPVADPAQGVNLTIDNHVYHIPVPKLPGVKNGMIDWVEDLWPGWTQAFGKLCELMYITDGAARQELEAKLIDHGTYYKSPEGQIYWGSDKGWKTYKDVLLATRSYEGKTTSYAQKASFVLRDVRQLATDFDMNGQAEIKVRNPANGGMMTETLTSQKPQQSPPQGEVKEVVQNIDHEVPF